jgi:hypothetical protein
MRTTSATDPPPLRAVVLRRVGRHYVSFRLDNTPPNGVGAQAIIEGVGKQTTEEPATLPWLPGNTYTAVTAKSDGETLYVARHRPDEVCTSEVVEVAFGADGQVSRHRPIPHTEAVAREIRQLALSPDGRLLAMTTGRLDDAYCQPTRTLPNLVVIDLATGSRRTWTQDENAPSGGPLGGGLNQLAWSFDGASIAFPWPIDMVWYMERMTLRRLDLAVAEGPLDEASVEVPRDDAFASSGRTWLRLVTSGQGEYPPELAAFQPQDGCRILAIADYPREVVRPGERPRPHTYPPLPGWVERHPLNPPRIAPGMVEVSLVTGRTLDVPR